MMRKRALRLGFSFLVLAGLGLALALPGLAGSARGAFRIKRLARAGLKDSKSVVKITAIADKPDADGKQIVTVTLNIDKGWHTYANPAEVKEVDVIPTTVTITSKTKPEKVEVRYPKGTFDNESMGQVYEDTAVIKAVVHRAKGDAGPLQLRVKIQACNKGTCLVPATVKLTVK